MRIDQENDQSIVIVHLGVSLDHANAGAFKKTCFETMAQGARHFILDFSETGILDSTGLCAINAIYRKVSRHDGQVLLAALSVPVQTVLNIARTKHIFPSYESVEEASSALS